LKSQVNPHFLFNSLNSLMNLLEDNPKAEQYVQNLSEYLRYVLLSSSRETVTLQEELENVEKYIDLQKLRFGENFEVEVIVNMPSLQMLIPPLALQMLVENCIQHNVISKSHPLKVRIFDDENRITVVNNLQKKADHESTGNGLKNIEGRYRFAEEGNLKVESDEHFFTVSIPLLKNKN
jgi:LytS/YehU family sensor histidine kinase